MPYRELEYYDAVKNLKKDPKDYPEYELPKKIDNRSRKQKILDKARRASRKARGK